MSEQAPNQGRRNFLAGMVAGVAGAAAIATGANRFMKHESEMKDIHERYKGQEANFSLAIEAMGQLQNRMEELKIEKVKIFGDSHSDDEIRILRDYLERHLNAKGVGYKYGDVQNKILQSGYFTISNLDTMKKRAEKARDE